MPRVAADLERLATRARVATEGMGARMLALQDADGQWAGGSYFPAGFDFEGPEAAPGAGQPWTATTQMREAIARLTPSSRGCRGRPA